MKQLHNKGNEGHRKKGVLKRQAEWEELVQDIVQKKKEWNQKCVPVKKEWELIYKISWKNNFAQMAGWTSRILVQGIGY